MTVQDLVSGGNVTDPKVKTFGYNYLKVDGWKGKELQMWVRLAVKQGITMTGAYKHNRFTGRVRCLNWELTGDADLVDALAASIEKIFDTDDKVI